ncbi:hypothetical protein K431DRAFT_164178 [Polychaeton citri CBS 116435]|uniref:Uncharacterized protein n=1 Tax=Polychaeton citri CBS 116435 TaxID=1314669 RepID=A0A9P4QFS4_9PEZI|nr:hypothetical protein K431DRAFT_164178 [Polychaeton citri CBS 116435]
MMISLEGMGKHCGISSPQAPDSFQQQLYRIFYVSCTCVAACALPRCGSLGQAFLARLPGCEPSTCERSEQRFIGICCPFCVALAVTLPFPFPVSKK